MFKWKIKQIKSVFLYLILSSLIVGVVCSLIFGGREIIKREVYPQKYKMQVEQCSIKYNIDKNLIYSVIKVESNFNKNAVSNKGAMGLMQITLDTAEYIARLKGVEFDKSDLFNENINIDFGCYYLRYLIDKFNSIETAICAYNAGETKVRGWLKNKANSVDGKSLTFIPINETREYLNKIQSTFAKYKKYY